MAERINAQGGHNSEGNKPSPQVSTGRSSEDLAGGLFNGNPLASVVRELQQRNKRKLQTKDEGKAGDDMPALTDMETGKAAGLWVVGGASTMLGGSTMPLPGPPGSQAVPQAAVVLAAQAQASDPDTGKEGGKAARRSPLAALGGYCRGSWRALMELCKELVDIACLYPGTLAVPLVVLCLCVGLGVWGVMAGAESQVAQRKDDARSRAVDAATGFQIQLQQSFTPGVTFSLLVRQRPEWEYWLQNFNETAAELMSRVPEGSLWDLQLQPFAQVMSIYPFRDSDWSQVQPPRDLLGDPTRRDDILRIIQTKESLVVGPFYLVQGFTGAFVRYPIYVPDVDANATFGFRYRENATALPYSALPASVRNCSVCYNATSREKWWGLMTVLVNYDAVTQGKDAYLANLRNMGFYYALVRPVNSSYEQVIAQVGPTSLSGADAVTVEVKVQGSVWLLRVAPAGGFSPSWRGPLIAAVVVISLVMALLLFVTMTSFRRQRLLLQETVAANHNLAETTKRLEEEKERMDVLLVRQYDLLRCLDANRGKQGDSPENTVGSKRAMMARIEDARRSLAAAKASVEDPIQVFEVLGAGAFGKVQRGLWRGSVVAVKTMILPANMSGQEKREKMAVMEAAISSSLVHPNIVTTYTYFIRPYREPSHDGVQQMAVPGLDPGSGGSLSRGADSQGGGSTASEGAIHSYEVRLVLEFCDKGSLKDALEQSAFMCGGALNLAAMLETAADVAKAMVHMHAANVLHSDLKARNIMLKSSGTEGRGVVAKVADFGLSTRMEHAETHLSSCFQGTLTHMAPEVMLEGRISKAADVYSFGILLWELFCGGDPFAGLPRAHMGHAITKEGRRPRFPPFAPRDYTSLAARCWDPEPSARPSFEAVLAELQRMREELGGGETRPLVITPPRPLTPNPSGGEAFGGKGTSGTVGGGEAGPLAGGGGGGGGGGVDPVALYKAGIVVGGASTTTLGGGGSGGAGSAGANGANGGGGSSGGGGGAGAGGVFGVGSAMHSALAQRAMMKSSVAQRQLRKMGIWVVGGGSTGLQATLPALHEDAEHREG